MDHLLAKSESIRIRENLIKEWCGEMGGYFLVKWKDGAYVAEIYNHKSKLLGHGDATTYDEALDKAYHKFKYTMLPTHPEAGEVESE